MAENTERIVKDADDKPAPQYYNPATGVYEYLHGAHGASRVLLYDANGNPLLTADNPGNVKVVNTDAEAVPTQLTGRKVEVETIIDAMSVAAGGDTGWVSLGITDEQKVFVAIAIDKQPWSAYANAPWALSSVISESLYPVRINVTDTYTTALPALSMLVIPSVNNKPTDYVSADVLAAVWDSARVLVKNLHDTDTATITVKVIRVWR